MNVPPGKLNSTRSISRRAAVLRRELMKVMPKPEWTFPLDVGEQPVLFILGVFGDPACSHWSKWHIQDHSAAGTDSAAALQHLHRSPRRSQPFERIRFLVEAEDRFDRCVDPTAFQIAEHG